MKKIEIAKMEAGLTELLGKESYTVRKTACRGKYAGLYDYSLVFNDDSVIYISTGKISYEKRLIYFIEIFENFFKNKSLAEQIGNELMKDTPFSDVQATLDENFWGVLTFRLKDGILQLRQTNLHYALVSGADNIEELIKKEIIWFLSAPNAMNYVHSI